MNTVIRDPQVLAGVGLVVFSPSSGAGMPRPVMRWYRMSIVGFSLAALSIMLQNYLGLQKRMDVLFKAGGVLFVVGAILPIVLYRNKNANKGEAD